jgi:NAD(P)-dependent dehydrogenase (short-subunit alcohol dehydrogenase family)
MPVLLVIGASRGVGLETVKRALGDGHRVRALARSAASVAVDQPELKKIQGDALDTATVMRWVRIATRKPA